MPYAYITISIYNDNIMYDLMSIHAVYVFNDKLITDNL